MVTATEKKYNYNMLSLSKLFMSILVIMIHTMAFSSLSEELWIGTSLSICRIAVPFFFIVSGYFFYNLKNTEDRINKIKKYTIFYFKALLLEGLILIPYIIFLGKTIPIVVLIKNMLLVGVTGSLWYISSMVIGLLFITPFLKNNRYKILIIFAIIFFLFGLSGDSYYGLFKESFLNNFIVLYKNFFVMMQVGFTASVPFLTIGILINKLNLLEKMKKTILCVIVGIILVLVEAFILYNSKIAIDYNLYFSLLIVAPALFILTMNSKKNISNKTSNICRKLSVLIYILHQPVMLVLMTFLPIMQNSLIKFILTLFITTIFSFILLAIKIEKFLKI